MLENFTKNINLFNQNEKKLNYKEPVPVSKHQKKMAPKKGCPIKLSTLNLETCGLCKKGRGFNFLKKYESCLKFGAKNPCGLLIN